ncbi:hypothetical protein BKA67DRAFT_410900 [Truncatella angustata]|uniref:Uncharacterized protein n=1 Tax=Truncatella angustata TaxID=152316 RepID=A0A9P8RM41_9PEZI|nr:uncharacterized protein BKA67DRAFT_410900 [Truncatella angustata]KAH6646561.1 hypothetical protein BKA67DRAFT_410900 [Truncatella angustata]
MPSRRGHVIAAFRHHEPKRPLRQQLHFPPNDLYNLRIPRSQTAQIYPPQRIVVFPSPPTCPANPTRSPPRVPARPALATRLPQTTPSPPKAFLCSTSVVTAAPSSPSSAATPSDALSAAAVCSTRSAPRGESRRRVAPGKKKLSVEDLSANDASQNGSVRGEVRWTAIVTVSETHHRVQRNSSTKTRALSSTRIQTLCS